MLDHGIHELILEFNYQHGNPSIEATGPDSRYP